MGVDFSEWRGRAGSQVLQLRDETGRSWRADLPVRDEAWEPGLGTPQVIK